VRDDPPICRHHCEHTDTVNKVRAAMAPEEELSALAELFKVLGDRTRARILEALAVSELCVCDLAAILCLSQSAVSHQLRLLRATKLVRYRKEGKNVFYSLDDEHVRQLFRQALEHVQEER